MTNPTPYRNKITGTIAWLNKPYENWQSIAQVLDAAGPDADKVIYLPDMRPNTPTGLDELMWKEFPITLTELPDEWEPITEEQNQ